MNPVLGYTSALSNVESIPMLNGSNFWEWKEHVLLVLALMDLDISIREDCPDAFKHTDETERWDRSNRVSMMIMRIRIPRKFKGIVPEDVTTAKGYLAAVEKCYAGNEMDMVEAELRSMRKEPNDSVTEYIMRKMAIAGKMKKIVVSDDVVPTLLLKSLPLEYDHLKRTYSLLQEKWSTHELISHCVQVEDSLNLKRDLDAGKLISGTNRKKFED